MRSTGIVRKVDNEGRFSPPAELLKALRIQAGDALVFTYDNISKITWIRKTNCCVNCNAIEDLEAVFGQTLCKKCKEKMVMDH